MINNGDNTTTLPCKVSILGDTGVGKSSIINRFVHSAFTENHLPTLGNCYSSKTVKFGQFKKGIKYDLWDTAGQEKYRAINRILFQGAEVIIFVFEITSRATFESIEEYWYPEVQERLPDALALVLVGNKADLYEYEEISTDEAKKMAMRIGAVYHCVSAWTSSGIDVSNRLFYDVGTKLLTKTSETELSPLEKSLSKAKSSLSVTLNVSYHSLKRDRSCCI